MSITDRGSVLILGAGASFDFGLPLGGQLIDIIKKATLKRQTHKNQWGDLIEVPSIWSPASLQPSVGLKDAISTLLAYQFFAARDRYTQDDLMTNRLEAFELGKALDSQTSDTIDDFISLNPKHSALAKLCIAGAFVEKLFRSEEHGSRAYPGNFGARLCQDGKTRNWIHLLINIARHHYRSAPPAHKIKIITFNYDGVLEHVLAKQFGNVEEKFGDYADYFEIIHPHGYCGHIPDETTDIWKMATAWARNICVVNEPADRVPENVAEARNRAKELIATADHIYAAGFSFSRPNCKLLGFYDLHKIPTISYHNFNNDIGIDLAVEGIFDRFVMRDVERSRQIKKGAGSEGRPLPIAEWIRAGYLGEMPG